MDSYPSGAVNPSKLQVALVMVFRQSNRKVIRKGTLRRLSLDNCDLPRDKPRPLVNVELYLRLGAVLLCLFVHG